MILRKPYAFIIKHFRLIHLILVACFFILFSRINGLYQLFVNLQTSNTYTYSGAGMYIDYFPIYIALVALALVAILYSLLKVKKKPTLLYLVALIYLIVIVIGFLYYFSVLKTLTEKNISIGDLIILKDILFLMRFPQYIFLALFAIRGIGFNIKKFNFSKDIAELQIADKDSEEYELLIGQNRYKYFRFIRRTIRELKYYIIENKFAITCFSGILLIIAVFYGISVYNEYIKRYSESESSIVNNIAYTVMNSYVTSENFNGEVIKEDYKYVVVELNLFNSGGYTQEVDLSKITIANKNLIYYPTLIQNDEFYDLGEPIKKSQPISTNSSITPLLIYELPKSVSSNSFTLQVQYDLENKWNNVVGKYRKFAINVKNIDTQTVETNIKLGDKISTNVNNENQYELTINDYKIMDSYDSKYVLCNKNLECRNISSIISSTANSLSTMLVLSVDSKIYKEAKFTNKFNSTNKIFTNFAKVKYKIYQSEYEEEISIVPGSNLDDKIFLLVPRRINNADEIKLIFNFRNNRFIVNLK